MSFRLSNKDRIISDSGVHETFSASFSLFTNYKSKNSGVNMIAKH